MEFPGKILRVSGRTPEGSSVRSIRKQTVFRFQRPPRKDHPGGRCFIDEARCCTLRHGF